MSEEKNNRPSDSESIEDILKAFQKQKDDREKGIDITETADKERVQIDFAKAEQADAEEARQETEAKPKRVKKPKKPRKKIDIKAIFANQTFRAVVITILAAALIAGAVFGSVAGIKSYREKAAVAYLKPYQEKYPKVKFPTGILEEYCELYAKDQKTLGKITIDDIKLDTVVSTKENAKKPYAEPSLKNSTISNYVVYLQDNALEEYYKDADAYNTKASGFMKFNNMFEEYSFKVVGAFYTNTKAKDDNGYIFPYNVTEKMTPKSTASFIDRLNTRFMYQTNVSIARDDIFLTVSCPTDYRKDFRFVVVAVVRDGDEKLTAQTKKSIRYPQVIFDELGQNNPYTPSEKWYPEIIITAKNGTTSTTKQNLADFE